MTALSALIAKLEAAREGSRELDAEILRYLNADNSFITGVYAAPDATFAMTAARGTIDIPHYTTSLDAALAEMPAYHKWIVGSSYAAVWQEDGRLETAPHCYNQNAALALIIAILKAKETEGE